LKATSPSSASPSPSFSGFVFQQAKPAVERFLEPGLFQFEGFGHQRFGTLQFRETPRPFPSPATAPSFHSSGILTAHNVRMAHGAAHDPAQHIAAPLVRRQHPVGNQEGLRAR
jgi:hypothetical protein